MIGTYLLDASAYWRFRREPETWAAWRQEITEGAVCLCDATRVEVLRSARSPAERRQMRELLDATFTVAPVSKDPWPWIDAAQEQLTALGQHRGAGVVDLLVAATAVDRGLVVLHDDRDFEAVARVIPHLDQQRIGHGPHRGSVSEEA
ncbi:MAG TPA: PIN domain-containing protein [Actinocrinis sp.]|nr:PIN domain-containing protein [Actinocrinis sp.]